MVAASFDSFKSRDHKAHKSKIHLLQWNCTGKLIATGAADRTIRTWQTEGLSRHTQAHGKPEPYERTLKHTADLLVLHWHPSEPFLLLSGTRDKRLWLWDATSGAQKWAVNIGIEPTTLAWGPSGSEVAVLGTDKVANDTVCFVPVASKPVSFRKETHNDNEVLDIKFSQDGTLLFRATFNGNIVEVLEYTNRTGQLLHNLRGHVMQLTSLTVSPDDKWLAVCAADAMLTMWNLDTMTNLWAFTRTDAAPTCATFSHDSQYVAFCQEREKTIRILDTASGAHLHTISTPEVPSGLAWNPKSSILAWSGYVDGRTDYCCLTLWAPP
ncbi:hypothetical protein WJX73_002305 [Symbiochloris irregularis]|uniref:WD40 repeat-like protein n=1 Tax=Symbiochloris irregularis TaxID=706552 RepID=A0AAW1PUP9_9CHLO